MADMNEDPRLEPARAEAKKALALLAKLEGVLAEVNNAYPGAVFGLTKGQLAKCRSPEKIHARVLEASRAVERAENYFAVLDRRERERQEKAAEDLKLQQKEAAKTQLREEAINYCLSHGEILGKRLSIENATRLADDIAFGIEVERLEAEIGEGYTSFSGDNCCGPCEGWNPQSKRCQCTNRRVSWSSHLCDFKDPHVYAEAY